MSEVCVAHNPFRANQSEGWPGAGSHIGFGGLTGRSTSSDMHLSLFRKHHGQSGSGPNQGRGARDSRVCTERDSARSNEMHVMYLIGSDRRFPTGPPMYLPGVSVILRESDEVKGHEESQRACPKGASTEELNLRRADGRKRGLQICR